jgi:hypothetical protein
MKKYFMRSFMIFKNQRPNLIGPDVDVEQVYSFFWSFRQGATTRATDIGVSEMDIDLIKLRKRAECSQVWLYGITTQKWFS